jgi:cytochrome c peroxidase
MKKYIILFAIAGITFCAQSFLGKKGPADKAALGELLFSNPILSRDKTVSCATCHIPAFAFADTLAVSRGVGKRKGTRNAPSSMNMRLQNIFFWDGRAKTLEEQALAPIENPDEMDLSIEEAVARLQNSETYSRYFKEIFDDVPGRANLAEAIAAFERTLETSDSPFDNWKFMDDSAAVSSAVKRGFALFNGKAKCVNCHFGADFTRHEFRNIGLFDGRKLNDSGRAMITKDKNDIGKFKIPGLRNVAITAPYMHNGMFTTLKEVIEFYNDPGKAVPRAINRDTAMAKPLGLTLREKKDLEVFLRSLTDKRFVRKKN